MAIRIYSRAAEKITSEEERACRRMVSSGVIFNVYSECCDPNEKLKNRVFIAKEDGKCIGWAIIHEFRKKDTRKHFEFMVYVKYRYRRKKIGTRLYKNAKKYFNLKNSEINVFNTDKINTCFYESLRGKEEKNQY